MSDEEVQVDKAEEHVEDKNLDMDDIEQQAAQLGWKPNKDDLPEGKEYVDAKTFMARAPLFEKIEELKKSHNHEIKEMKAAVKDLANTVKKSERQGYEQALKDIQEKRMQAVVDGDSDAFTRADEAYSQLRDAVQDHPEQEEPSISEEATSFKERNKDWFNFNNADNALMAREALAFDAQLYNARPDIEDGEAASLIEEYIHKKFPDRFANQAKKKPNAVDSGTRVRSRSGDKITFDDLTEQQQSICKTLTRSIDGYTVDEYIKGLQDAGVKF